MPTKFIGQLRFVRRTILRRGTFVTWYKPGADNGADPTPEFPELADALEYDKVPIVFYPLNRQSYSTVLFNQQFEAGVLSYFGAIPGDVPFIPEENDPVLINNKLLHVSFVNTTMPDGTPLVHELGFK